MSFFASDEEKLQERYKRLEKSLQQSPELLKEISDKLKEYADVVIFSFDALNPNGNDIELKHTNQIHDAGDISRINYMLPKMMKTICEQLWTHNEREKYVIETVRLVVLSNGVIVLRCKIIKKGTCCIM